MTESTRLGSRLFDACVAVFLGALALYAAVLLIQAVWLWLLGIAVVVAAGWLLWSRQRRW